MDVKEAMKKHNDVATILSWLLFSGLAKRSNSVFSPASINAVFTMMASAPTDCSISDEILSFLGSSSIDELNSVFSVIANVLFVDRSNITAGPTIKVANGVWIDQSIPIDPSSKTLFENSFRSVLTSVDFRSKAEEVRKEVNEWALRHTNGLIEDLLPKESVTSQTDWIYGNALYFKGAWENKFYKSMTKHKDFHLLNGTSVSVPFMSSYEKQYIEAYDGFKVLKLPFRQGNDDTNRGFSMYFYLPDEKYGLDHLVKRMASTPGFLDSQIPSRKYLVGEFRIPKFKIKFGFSVKSAFGRSGMDLMDFYHKAQVEIDEEGAEAAVATAFAASSSCPLVTEKTIDFVADHPFLFVIREDKTGTVLFVGQIFDPSKSS